MAGKLDWFPFYAAVFSTDEAVRLMDCFQVGCYTLWLCHQWINGSLPADKSQAFQLLQPALSPLADQHDFDRAADVLERCFPPTDDDPTRRQNRKLETIRSQQAATRTRLSEAGRKGGRPKGQQSRNEKPGFSQPAKPGFAVEKSREEEKKYQEKPADWLPPFLRCWEICIGMAPASRIRDTLSPLIDAHGVHQVWGAWDGYCRRFRGKPGEVRYASPRKFAEGYQGYATEWARYADEAGTDCAIPSTPGLLRFPDGHEPRLPVKLKAVPA